MHVANLLCAVTYEVAMVFTQDEDKVSLGL